MNMDCKYMVTPTLIHLMFTDTTDANSLKSSKHTSANFCNLYIRVLKDQKYAPKIIY